MKAWHFVGKTLRDGSPVPPDGEKLIFTDEPILCEQGYHASDLPWDALRYAPGNILCRVECGGKIIKGSDKLVCTERTIIRRIDATKMLQYFARMKAVEDIHLYPNDNDDVVFDFLMTGENANAAYTAAYTAKVTHATQAATYAAKATYAATYATAYTTYAANSAAYATAYAAATYDAGYAACAAYANEFNQLVFECFD